MIIGLSFLPFILSPRIRKLLMPSNPTSTAASSLLDSRVTKYFIKPYCLMNVQYIKGSAELQKFEKIQPIYFLTSRWSLSNISNSLETIS